MLILSRHPGESIRIGDDIHVRVLAVEGHQVRLGFEAPADIAVNRREVAEAIAVRAQGGAAKASGRSP